MHGRSKCQQGMISIWETKRNHIGTRYGEYGVRQNSYFFFLQKRRNYCGGMSVGIVEKASFLIILFQFLQYYVFVVLSGDVFSPALLLRLLH